MEHGDAEVFQAEQASEFGSGGIASSRSAVNEKS